MSVEYRTYHIAKLYYVDGYKQNEIAKMLHITPMMVSRALKKAMAEQIVTVQVNAPNNTDLDLEARLRKKYQKLRDIVVIKVDEGADVYQQFSQGAAQYVSSLLYDGCTIGLSWGKTIFAFVRALQPTMCKNVSVLQLAGNFLIENNVTQMMSNVIKMASEKLRCNAVFLNSPISIATEEMRDMLLEEPSIKRVLEMAGKSQINVVGFSDISENATVRKANVITDGDMQKLLSLSAVGDIMGEYMDANGDFIQWKQEKCCIGAKANDLDPEAFNISLACNEKKAYILGLIAQKGYINTIVVTQDVARKMLEL